LLARATARLAAPREDHVAAHRAHGAATLARQARTRRAARLASAGAAAARIPARDRQITLRSMERVLERERQRLMQIGSALNGRLPPRVALGDHVRHEVAKRPAVIRPTRRKVEPLEPRRPPFALAVHRMTSVVAMPPLGIDQGFVGFEDLPE